MPVMTLPLQKGFLAKIIRNSNTFADELHKIIEGIFLKLDENFNTLKPERFDKKLFLRRILLDSFTDKQLSVSYNFSTKNIVVLYDSKESKFIDYESLELELNHILKSSCLKAESLECGICYSDFLDGSMADYACSKFCLSGKGCNQVYHEGCLREWFRANPESRTIFDKICGKCLFCEKVIKLRMLRIF